MTAVRLDFFRAARCEPGSTGAHPRAPRRRAARLLEGAPGGPGGCGEPHQGEVDDRPGPEKRAGVLSAAEGAELDDHLLEADRVGGDRGEPLLVERLERKSPRGVRRDVSKGLRVDGLADLAEQTGHE